MRQPESVRDLMNFKQVTNLMRLSLPNTADGMAPLSTMVEERLRGANRAKRITYRRVLADEEWIADLRDT